MTHSYVSSEVQRFRADPVVSVEVTLSPARPAPASKRESLASPPRHRRGLKPGDIVHAEEEAEAQEKEKEQEARKQSTEIQDDLPRVTFPTSTANASFGFASSPTFRSEKGEEREEVLAGLREKILNDDGELTFDWRLV